MDDPTDEGWRAAQPQRAAVLLRVTCVKGYWKGAAHYHHILPPPEGSDQAWFDHGKFLKNTTSPRGIVRIAAKCLVSDRSRIDEALEGLIEGVVEELKNIYEEDMVMTGDWVALRNDSDGEMVDGDFSLRELIDGFLKSRPGAGEPLVLTPIPQRDYWHEN